MIRLWYLSQINFHILPMMVFTSLQEVKIVEFWYQTKSFVSLTLQYCFEFNVRDRDRPKKYEIDRFMKHFESTGTV